MALSALPLPSTLGGKGKGERDGSGAGDETGVSIARPDLPSLPSTLSAACGGEGATVK
jgi:hypothetical protein